MCERLSAYIGRRNACLCAHTTINCRCVNNAPVGHNAQSHQLKARTWKLKFPGVNPIDQHEHTVRNGGGHFRQCGPERPYGLQDAAARAAVVESTIRPKWIVSLGPQPGMEARARRHTQTGAETVAAMSAPQN